MKRIWFFLLGSKAEIISAITSITVVMISLSYKDRLTALVITVVVLVVFLTILIYVRTRGDRRRFYYLSLTKPKEKKDWVGRGTWDYSKSNRAYLITNSTNGFIFAKCLLWDDYVVNFDFKIVRNCNGWIVRARDLSNYVMLQCGLVGINPHVKLRGIWHMKSHADSDVNLTFDNQLHLDVWYKARIYCEKSHLTIQIRDQKRLLVFDRIWEIPENLVFRYKEKIEEEGEGKPIALPVDLDFGTIGFRCWSHEKSLIRDLLIQKI